MCRSARRSLAAGGVPDTHGAVVGCGDDARAVGAEARIGHLVFVPVQYCDLAPRGGVEDVCASLPAPVTIRVPSALKAAERTGDGCLRTSSSRPLAASQMRAVPSVEAVTIRAPSGLKRASLTVSVCPLRTPISRLLAASHICAVPSMQIARRCLPSD